MAAPGGSSGSGMSGMIFMDDPIIQAVTHGKPSNYTFMSVAEGDPLYTFVVTYIPQNMSENRERLSKHLIPMLSTPWSYKAAHKGSNMIMSDPYAYGFGAGRSDDKDVDEAEIAAREKRKKKEYVDVSAGFGFFTILFQEVVIRVLHRSIGEPVGTSYRPAVQKELILFVEGSDNALPLVDFMEFLSAKNDSTVDKDDVVQVFRFNIQYGSWDRFYTARSRPEGSVVLPLETKQKILDDVRDFIASDTRRWYYEKGIPYKRSYLFYGIPGSGKTSIITVLAGKYKRPICYISPTDPKMSDDLLKVAVMQAPTRGIIIFEDVDGLFNKDRSSSVNNALTFSGLLNALDGVGSGLGQIFILTTNHRERLDKALIRNGRVDLQVEFTHVTGDQVEEMFQLFYSKATHKECISFREKIFTLAKQISSEPCISAAMLQNFFITHRRCTPKEAVEQAGDLIEDVQHAFMEQKELAAIKKQKEDIAAQEVKPES